MASSADYILSERCEKFTARASSPYINRSLLLNSQRRLLASSSLTSGSGRGRRIDGVTRSRQADSNDRYWCDRARKGLRELEKLEHAVLLLQCSLACTYAMFACIRKKHACIQNMQGATTAPARSTRCHFLGSTRSTCGQPRRVPVHRVNVKPARIARHTITELPDTVPR